MTDFGPSVRTRTDGRLISRGPGAVTLEDRPDLDREPDRSGNRPVVRGARRRCALDGLFGDNAITKRQLDAANRFLDDLCRAQGSSQSSIGALLTGGVSGSAGRDAFTEGQRGAIRRVQKVRLMLGLSRETVTWWVVIENRTPRQYDDAHSLRHGTGVQWLCMALDALDVHYNPPGRRDA